MEFVRREMSPAPKDIEVKTLTNPIAVAALNRAISAARNGPAPRPSYNSRTADKFVIRGYVELFSELAGIGKHQGRSMNSEAVAAILEALAGQRRNTAMLNILKTHLGQDLSERVLAEVPDFDLSKCKTPRKFVIRLPESARALIRDGVIEAIAESGDKSTSMNTWLLNALVEWIKSQRQQYALLMASIAMEQALLPNRPQ